MLQEFLSENPEDAFARYGLALEYAKTGQVDTAMAEFKTLLARNPDYTAAYQMAAQTLMSAERFDEARKYLEDGIACARRGGNQHAASEMQGMLDTLPL